MQRLFPGRSALGFLAGLAVLLLPELGWAKGEKGEDVKFDTVDKVELRGTFYAGAKNKPTVLLVHKFGGKRDRQGWNKLAETLHNKGGYAVLSFDLRGHGDSTTVDSDFWKGLRGANRSLVRGFRPDKTTISYKEFAPTYKPLLVNDLAAAKRYLDAQNNAGACNSSDLIVIGAEDGAALAALWIAYEWQRRPLEKTPFGLVQKSDAKPEGTDIAAGIWLSAPKTWGSESVARWLRSPLDMNGTPLFVKSPMLFLYGKNDKKSAEHARQLLDALKRAGGRLTTFPKLTATKGFDGKSIGEELLGKEALGTDEFIADYIESVMDKRGNTFWRKRPEGEADAPQMEVDRRVLANLIR